MGEPLVLVVIVGPQASGKSTIAAALADALRHRGETVALVELDAVAGMALPTLPDWGTAHAIFETVVGMWTRSALTCVVAEGSGSRDEVDRVLARSSVAIPVVVALDAPFDLALARAHADPTRGVSRSAGFLRPVYARWTEALPRFGADLVLPTAELSVPACVEIVLGAVAAARTRD